ncbi:helix-turn-helix domain-containing protein [Sandarakinorhabdus oryzae]|uniref:helix-turn-helix domain-containing protein n=1 Tax=Sandarakinorhabdus oryzae TaxID=2675220 RepID=UPI0018CC420E|nr:MerR family transcriptional regulator [Sandarakinorhabdus oryzae]
MVHGQQSFRPLLISEFARVTGLSTDTIRYYVRRDLLRPQLGAKGGRNPYQLFSEADVRTAELIRLGQALGLSLAEIGALLKEEQAGQIDDERSLSILREHRHRLATKAAELQRLVAYLDAKIAWVAGGSRGPVPAMADFAASTSPSAIPPAAGWESAGAG